MSAPIAYRVTDDGMLQPLARFRRQFDETFVCQAIYILEEREDRSSKSHAQFFAQVADVWGNLGESYNGRWATPEHYRKWLLIKAGFCDHQQHVCATNAEAVRLCAALRPMDTYAVVSLNGCVADVYTAHSMSMRAMDKRQFQAAKDAIFAIMDEMLGVAPGDTDRSAARAV